MGNWACACGECDDTVRDVGHYRKACRQRIEANGGVCPRNVKSSATKLYNLNIRPARNLINNPKNNPKNNPVNSKQRKNSLRAANIQAVLDDPTLNATLKMSAGTSTSVSDCTHKTHLFTHRHLTELIDIDNGDIGRANHRDCGQHLQPYARQDWQVHRGKASLQPAHDLHAPHGSRHIQAQAFHVVSWHHYQADKEGKLLAHSIACVQAIKLCVCVQLNADMAGKS